MKNKPAFNAYNEGSEPFRINRLHAVWGYAIAQADHYGNSDLQTKVAELYDHKGILIVKWKEAGSPGEKDFFSRAWTSCIGDSSDNVEHEIV